MPIRSISPRQAAELLAAFPSPVYLDVRSREEFSRGHPAPAYNVPLLHRDPESGRLVPNPDFLRVVQAAFPPETPLLLGCLSGGRSLTAAGILERAGYRDLSNIEGGFGGTRNLLGKVVHAGWADLGLPVERDEPPGRSYESLLARARP